MMIELTGQEVLATLTSLGVTMLMGIYCFRIYKNRGKTDARKEYSMHLLAVANRTKYPSKDILRHRSKTFGIGIACSIAFAVVAMSWTIYELPEAPKGEYVPMVIPLEVIPPRTPPPQPPPPPPPIVEAVEDDIPKDQPKLIEPTIEPDEAIPPPPFPPAPIEPAPLPPPPPIPEEGPSDLPFKIVEKMPMFGECKDKDCSDKALLNYIYDRIDYPSLARENGVEGRITAEFVIERNGSLTGLKILRGIGAGCDKEVLKVLSAMNNERKWTAGEQRGKKVRVLYRLPVSFKLGK